MNLKKLQDWRKNKNRKMKDGIELIKEHDSKYTTFFRENDDAEIGSMAFNLLDARVERLIRIASQNSKKKENTEEKSKESEEQKLKEEATKLMNLAKAAKTKAEKAMKTAEEETDPEKKKELEEKAMEAMQKAEDALKKAEDFSARLKKQ